VRQNAVAIAVSVGTSSTLCASLGPMLKSCAEHAFEADKAAARERFAHAAALDCADTIDAVAGAEAGIAYRIDPRVTSTTYAAAAARADAARTIKPASQTVLCGFTRLLDAKISLDARALATLVDQLTTVERTQLATAIDAGPGDGDVVWPRPATRVELVASLVRQLVLGSGASSQLQVSPALAAFVEHAAIAAGSPNHRALGGAGAFATNVLAALEVQARFFACDPLPTAIAERFADAVEIVDRDGARRPARQASCDDDARINVSCEYGGGQPFRLGDDDTLAFDGVQRRLVTSGAGRVILGSTAADIVPGFDGVTDEALARIAADVDIFFCVGTHYLTRSEDAGARAAVLARHLDIMRSTQPRLLRHLQYVVPKVAAREIEVLAALGGHVDSLSMNAVEAPALLHRLARAGLVAVDVDEHQSRTQSEEPEALVHAAFALAEALQLSRVHLHGMLGDLVVQADVDDPERVCLALLRARQLASMKAAIRGGELVCPQDLFDVAPTLDGAALAAVERFADVVARRFSLDAAARTHVAQQWHCRRPSSRQHVFFVPSRGIHDRAGGTVSLGDTIDIAALVFSTSRTS
jgi:ADP-dependent phosphofructokinase/glucokinase